MHAVEQKTMKSKADFFLDSIDPLASCRAIMANYDFPRQRLKPQIQSFTNQGFQENGCRCPASFFSIQRKPERIESYFSVKYVRTLHEGMLSATPLLIIARTLR